jgi:hypothetical protein
MVSDTVSDMVSDTVSDMVSDTVSGGYENILLPTLDEKL